MGICRFSIPCGRVAQIRRADKERCVKMADVIRKSSVKILVSTSEDVNAEYVWTNCINEAEGGNYFKIKVGNNACYVRVRFADTNFCRNYSDPSRSIKRYQIRDDDQFLVMSKHYRKKCGGLKPYSRGGELVYDVELIRTNQMWGEFWACWDFPTHYVRWEIVLSVIGIVLGAVSLFCSVFHRQTVGFGCPCGERIRTSEQCQMSEPQETVEVSRRCFPLPTDRLPHRAVALRRMGWRLSMARQAG